MTEQHPITLPPELVHQWLGEFFGCTVTGALSDSELYLATQAARWGADQELEACLEAIKKAWEMDSVTFASDLTREVRATRRPKPPSLAEQALEQLSGIRTAFKVAYGGDLIDETIRAALERLQELEKGNG